MNEVNNRNGSSYDSDDIEVLVGLEPVRVRPGMYIGDTENGDGLHHMITEVVDNAIDEVAVGGCTRIIVTIHADGAVSVDDNGRGIPTGIKKGAGPNGEDLPAATVVMTVLHAGGKFDQSSYGPTGGLHGVGVSVVNALSEYLQMTIHRDGKVYYQEFAAGEPQADLKVTTDSERTGTIIRFKPSDQYFTLVTEINFDRVRKRLRELTYFNPELQIDLRDERTGRKEVMRCDGGIAQYVADLNQSREPLNEEVVSIAGESNGVTVNVALQWCNNYFKETTRSYTNNIFQADGGTHTTGFRRGLTKTITDYMQKNKLSGKIDISGEDIREGLTAILLIKVPDPKFSSQTKDKLVSSSVEGVVSSVLTEGLSDYLENHPKTARLLCDKVNKAATARKRAKQARETIRKSGFESTALPGKLADCQERDPQNSEIFLVEGESAGGSAKQARDRKYQAILPLKGKILNVHKATLDKVVASEEIQTLITALGAGVGQDFDIEKLRYNRIIIMTDADVDGSHIRTLLLTFFFNEMPQLIEKGHLYIAQPPLYKAKYKKSEKYLSNDNELDAYVLDNAIQDVKVELRNGAESEALVIQESALKKLCNDRIEARQGMANLSDRIDPQVLSVLKKLETPDATRFDDLGHLEGFAQKLADALRAEAGTYTVEVVPHNGDGAAAGHAIKVTKEHMGNHTESIIDEMIIRSKSYRSMTALAEQMRRDQISAVIVCRGAKAEQHVDLYDAVDWLMQDARQGMTIQRYKGLGEMNADQLRETTMDMKERLLRQVKIDDEVNVGKTFDVLMGDKVPPRRAFIEKEALSAKNIDI